MAIFYGKKSSGRKKRVLTQEEKDTATKLYKSGKTAYYISKHMGINYMVIKREINN